MRVDMRLDGLQFQFLHQCFQPERIQLLFAAFGYIVVNKVDKIPDKEINEEIEDPTEYQQQFIVLKFLLSFAQQMKLLQQFGMKIGGNHRKDKSDQQEDEQLAFEFILKYIQRNDHHSHQVGEYKTQSHKKSDTARYLYHFSPGIELIEQVRKKDADKGKASPADHLKYPIS
jgi:hypothetical protein